MTLIYFSASRLGVWAALFNFEIGLQFSHDRYAAPYLLFKTPWRKLYVSAGSVVLYKSNRGKPAVYSITHAWGANHRKEAS